MRLAAADGAALGGGGRPPDPPGQGNQENTYDHPKTGSLQNRFRVEKIEIQFLFSDFAGSYVIVVFLISIPGFGFDN